MTQHYIFHEPGSAPGVPGRTFAHCIVVVGADGQVLSEEPLPQQPHDVPAEDVPAAEGTAQEESSADEAEPAQTEAATPAIEEA